MCAAESKSLGAGSAHLSLEESAGFDRSIIDPGPFDLDVPQASGLATCRRPNTVVAPVHSTSHLQMGASPSLGGHMRCMPPT